MNRKLPNPEQLNYGNDRYEEGYKRGWDRRTYDINRIKILRDRYLHIKYGYFVDFLDDIISKNKRK